MKYIKTYEKLNIVKFSNLDKILDSVKNKLLNDIEKEFSKYLTPTNIILNNKEVKAFLFKPDFGIYFILDFINQPYRIDINIHIVYKTNDKWKKSSHIKLTKYTDYYITYDKNKKDNVKYKDMSSFVEKYYIDLKTKYIERENRIFKKDVNRYNL